MFGKAHFKTKLGGCLSLIFYALVLTNATEKMIRLVRKDDPDLISIQKQIDLKGKPYLNLGDHGIEFMAFVKKRKGKDVRELPANIGSIVLRSVEFYKAEG